MVLSKDKFFMDDPMDAPEPVALMRQMAQEKKPALLPLTLKPTAYALKDSMDVPEPVTLMQGAVEEDDLILEDDWFMSEKEEMEEAVPVPPAKPSFWERGKEALQSFLTSTKEAVSSLLQPRKWAMAASFAAVAASFMPREDALAASRGFAMDSTTAASSSELPQPGKIDWHNQEETKEYKAALDRYFDQNPVESVPGLYGTQPLSFVVDSEHAGMGITQAFAHESAQYGSLMQDPVNASLSFTTIMETLEAQGVDGNDLRQGDRLTMEFMEGQSWALLSRGNHVYPFKLFPDGSQTVEVAAHEDLSQDPVQEPQTPASENTSYVTVEPADPAPKNSFVADVADLAEKTDPRVDVCDVRDMSWDTMATMSLKDLNSARHGALERMKKELEVYQYKYLNGFWTLEGTKMDGTVYIYKIGRPSEEDVDGAISIKWHAQLDVDSPENQAIAEILAYRAVEKKGIPQLVLKRRDTCFEPD